MDLYPDWMRLGTGSGTSGTGLVGELSVTVEGAITAIGADEGLVGILEDGPELTLEDEIEVGNDDEGLTGETC